MDRSQALHSFWSSFGLMAYDQYSVPDGAQMPYITYTVSLGGLNDVVVLSASLWYRDTSWKSITEKAEEVSNYLGYSGRLLEYDDGALFLVRGNPFINRMTDDTDKLVKRIIFNLNAEYLTGR